MPGLKRVRLMGARFQGGRLPVDSLAELQKYQDVVRIAAEAEWRFEHQGEALPADLRDSVSLTIERIDEGSADVFLAFEQHAAYAELQTQALDASDAIIVAAYSGAPLPDLPALPPESDYLFREAVAQIGITLEPEQSIEFYPSAPDSSPVTISVETRKQAVDELARLEDFLVAVEEAPITKGLKAVEDSKLTGHITAINAEKHRFSLRTEIGEVHGFYRSSPELLEEFRALVNSAAEGPLTRITGDLQFKNGTPWRFRSVSEVEQVQFDETEWGARLGELATLSTGWDGGSGVPISSVSLDASQKLLQAFDAANLDPPGIFPTAEGGVLIEWASATEVRSIEVLPDGEFELFALQRGQRQGQHGATEDLTRAVAFITGEPA